MRPPNPHIDEDDYARFLTERTIPLQRRFRREAPRARRPDMILRFGGTARIPWRHSEDARVRCAVDLAGKSPMEMARIIFADMLA